MLPPLSLNVPPFILLYPQFTFDVYCCVFSKPDQKYYICFQSTNGTKQFSCVIAENFCQEALQKAEDLGVTLAKKMVKSGAGDILWAAKRETEAEILKAKAVKEAAKETARTSNGTAQVAKA